MIIIGEKINGAIPSVKKAIAERDYKFIESLAVRQAKAGADYLDVCAGTSPEEEYEALAWLIDVVQSAVDTPSCIDSPDPRMLVKVFPLLRRPGLINSISLEGDKCEVLLPLLKENPEWGIIALCCDNSGIKSKAGEKAEIAFRLIERAEGFGIEPGRIHIDPLVLALSAVGDSAVNFLEAVRRIKARCPGVKVTAALSNISFGMPLRKIINTNFLTLCMQAGLDSVIADPLDRELIATIYATEALLARDPFCRRYNTAYRKGILGEAKKA